MEPKSIIEVYHRGRMDDKEIKPLMLPGDYPTISPKESDIKRIIRTFHLEDLLGR